MIKKRYIRVMKKGGGFFDEPKFEYKKVTILGIHTNNNSYNSSYLVTDGKKKFEVNAENVF